MDKRGDHGSGAQQPTPVAREGERGLILMRTFNAAPTKVYQAWSQPALFRRWWMPQSASGVSLVSCDMDVRTGGRYRLQFSVGGPDTMAFHGQYLDVVPDERIVWTNDEGEEGAVTTVTFEGGGEKTLLTFREVYPSADAREEALQGSASALPEQLDQLAQLLCATGGVAPAGEPTGSHSLPFTCRPVPPPN